MAADGICIEQQVSAFFDVARTRASHEALSNYATQPVYGVRRVVNAASPIA